MKIIEQTLEESNAYSWFGNMQLDHKQQQMIIFGDKIFSITLINFRSYKKNKRCNYFSNKTTMFRTGYQVDNNILQFNLAPKKIIHYYI